MSALSDYNLSHRQKLFLLSFSFDTRRPGNDKDRIEKITTFKKLSSLEV